MRGNLVFSAHKLVNLHDNKKKNHLYGSHSRRRDVVVVYIALVFLCSEDIVLSLRSFVFMPLDLSVYRNAIQKTRTEYYSHTRHTSVVTFIRSLGTFFFPAPLLSSRSFFREEVDSYFN